MDAADKHEDHAVVNTSQDCTVTESTVDTGEDCTVTKSIVDTGENCTVTKSTVDTGEDCTVTKSTVDTGEDCTVTKSIVNTGENCTMTKSTVDTGEDCTVTKSTVDTGEDCTVTKSIVDTGENCTMTKSTVDTGEDCTVDKSTGASYTYDTVDECAVDTGEYAVSAVVCCGGDTAVAPLGGASSDQMLNKCCTDESVAAQGELVLDPVAESSLPATTGATIADAAPEIVDDDSLLGPTKAVGTVKSADSEVLRSAALSVGDECHPVADITQQSQQDIAMEVEETPAESGMLHFPL
jgi:hypothetical protein